MSAQTNTNRLSASDWAAIVTLYQRGDKNVRELSEEYSVSLTAIRKGLASRGIEKNSALGDVVSEVVDAASAARAAKVVKANGLVDSYSKWFDAIAKITVKKVSEGERDGTLATKNAEVLVLKNAIAIIKEARNETWEINDISDLLGEDAELPDLNVGEYTPEELDGIREANEASFQDSLDDDDDQEGDADSGTV